MEPRNKQTHELWLLCVWPVFGGSWIESVLFKLHFSHTLHSDKTVSHRGFNQDISEREWFPMLAWRASWLHFNIFKRPIPSGKCWHNYGKSPVSLGKFAISIWPFSIAMWQFLWTNSWHRQQETPSLPSTKKWERPARLGLICQIWALEFDSFSELLIITCTHTHIYIYVWYIYI